MGTVSERGIAVFIPDLQSGSSFSSVTNSLGSAVFLVGLLCGSKLFFSWDVPIMVALLKLGGYVSWFSISHSYDRLVSRGGTDFCWLVSLQSAENYKLSCFQLRPK